MARLIIKGPLYNVIGSKEIKIDTKISLYNLLKLSKIYDYIFKNNKLRSDFLVFINGKDWRLFNFNDIELNENDVVEIVSINHGG